MFRFVHAWQPGDSWDPALTAEGFVGVESPLDPPEGVTRIGVRHPATLDVEPDATSYVVIAAPDKSPSDAGRDLRALAERLRRPIRVENGGAFQTAHRLWTLMEATRHPLVAIALDADMVRAAGESPAVIVPTLNLRIGLLRVRTDTADLASYARRLAGIGFDGFVVTDPPPGSNRLAAARSMAAVFRSVFPVKPPKKAVPAVAR